MLIFFSRCHHPRFILSRQIASDGGGELYNHLAGEYIIDMPQNPPLYLHVTSTTKEGLDKAIAKIDELMQQELPNLIDERRFRKREPDFERDELGRVCWSAEKLRRMLTIYSANGLKPRYP